MQHQLAKNHLTSGYENDSGPSIIGTSDSAQNGSSMTLPGKKKYVKSILE